MIRVLALGLMLIANPAIVPPCDLQGGCSMTKSAPTASDARPVRPPVGSEFECAPGRARQFAGCYPSLGD